MQKSKASILRLATAICCVLAVAQPAYATSPLRGMENAFNDIIILAVLIHLLFLGLYLKIGQVLVRRILYSVALGVAILLGSHLSSKFIGRCYYCYVQHPYHNIFETPWPLPSKGQIFFYSLILLTFFAPLIRRRIYRDAPKAPIDTKLKLIAWILPSIITITIALPVVVSNVNSFFTAKVPWVNRKKPSMHLIAASKAGDLEYVKKILQEHPTQFDKWTLRTAFHFAIENNRPALQKYFLSRNIYPNLQSAAKYGKKDIVVTSLKNQPELIDSREFIDAEIACIEKMNYELLEVLASYKTPYYDHQNAPEINTPKGAFNSVVAAMRHNDMKALRIVAPHTDLGITVGGHSVPVLHYTVKEGQIEHLEYLLTLNPNVDIRASGEGTPMHYAAKYGKIEAMQMLLDKGADINGLADENTKTPLVTAISWEQYEAIEFLLDVGARVDEVAIKRSERWLGGKEHAPLRARLKKAMEEQAEK